LKIFGIALTLLILMAAVALLRMRMTRTVDNPRDHRAELFPGLCHARLGQHSLGRRIDLPAAAGDRRTRG
jgi:hypothetical protein